MIHKIYLTINAMLFCLLISLLACCDSNDMEKGGMSMDGEDFITAFSINKYPGVIDNEAKTVKVLLEPGMDLTKLVPEFHLSPGAESNIPSGSTVDFTMPVLFKITNGNTYVDYTVTVGCYEAKILAFTFMDASGNAYPGTIDETNHTIKADLPNGTDVTRLTTTYSLSEGAQATPASGSVHDFSSPVVYTVTNHGEKLSYSVSAVSTDMPVTAFIGTAVTVDGLKPEEKAAAEWMLANVPRSRYISMVDIRDGKVILDPTVIKALWWHGDRNDWPSEAWDSKEQIKEYYANGGSLLLSRYACRYVNDVYQIAIDQKQPNYESVSPSAIQVSVPSGFTVDDAEHAVFENMSPMKEQPIYLLDKGNSTLNCRVDWNLYDYSADHSLESWEDGTGAKRLAYETDDSNNTAIVEFPARDTKAGKVILVGTGTFEWSVTSASQNPYAKNRTQLTMNILRYLVGLKQLNL